MCSRCWTMETDGTINVYYIILIYSHLSQIFLFLLSSKFFSENNPEVSNESQNSGKNSKSEITFGRGHFLKAAQMEILRSFTHVLCCSPNISSNKVIVHVYIINMREYPLAMSLWKPCNLTLRCVSSPAGSCVKSSRTCWPRTGLPWATQGPPPSWSRASRAASPTSPSSRMASARLPSALLSPPSRTTSPRLSKD